MVLQALILVLMGFTVGVMTEKELHLNLGVTGALLTCTLILWLRYM